MSIPPEEKMFNSDKIEKKILRDQFIDYLPTEVLYRKKEAFSDGVSKHERSWYQIIQEYVDTIYTDEEFLQKRKEFKINQPYDKESLYYRVIFEEYYHRWANTIPYFWKQPFSKEEQKDPSARLL
jgi:asparagine synthase (glutamine-hydrolysing)